jgi:hypothetical protein
MKRSILILTGDREISQQLAGLFQSAGVDDVTVVTSMREACLALSVQNVHLALVSQAKAAHQVRTLQAICPELPIILVADASEVSITDVTLDKTLGLYTTAQLGTSLPKLLSLAWPQDQPGESSPRQQGETAGSGRGIDLALEAACAEVDWREEIAQVVMAVEGQVVTFCGEDDEAMAAAVAEEAWQALAGGGSTPQVQYLRLGKPPRAVMFYTRPFAGGLLTTVADPRMPVYTIRQWAQRLVGLVIEQSGDYPIVGFAGLASELAEAEESDEHTFALAWRPVKQLPEEMQEFIRRRIPEVAKENLCILGYLSVQERLIHLVLTCPPGRSSAWAVKLFKESTEQAVRLQYPLSDSLWQRGYLAGDPVDPSTTTALDLFLDRTGIPEE